MAHPPYSTDYAITHNLTPFISMQNHYSLLYREEEREMLPTLKVSTTSVSALCHHARLTAPQQFNVGAIPWSPLGRGLLTRPLNVDTIRKNTDA